jgi:hypothetical protein
VVLYTSIFPPVVIPLVLAIVFNLVLTPVVLALARVKVPAPAGAGLVVFLFLLVLASAFPPWRSGGGLAAPAACYVIDQLSDKLYFVQVPAKQLKQAEDALSNLGGTAPDTATQGRGHAQSTTLRRCAERDLALRDRQRHDPGVCSISCSPWETASCAVWWPRCPTSAPRSRRRDRPPAAERHVALPADGDASSTSRSVPSWESRCSRPACPTPCCGA